MPLIKGLYKRLYRCYPPASKASTEVANFTERKNTQPPYLIFHLTRTKIHLKKSLHVWLPELFLQAFFFKNSLIMTFWPEIITLTRPICWGV